MYNVQCTPVTLVAPNKNVHVIKCMLLILCASYNVQCAMYIVHWSHWWPHTPQLTLPHASSRCQEDKRKLVKTAKKHDDGIRKEQWFQIVPLPNLSLNLATPTYRNLPKKKPLTACPQNSISIYHAGTTPVLKTVLRTILDKKEGEGMGQ